MVVMVVRKFLEQKLKGKIECRSIAPSPFHANFIVEQSDRSSVDLADKSDGRAGISTLQFTVPRDGNPLDHIIRTHNDLFGRFYYLSTLRSKLIRERGAIVTGISGIVDEPVRGVFAKLKSLRTMREEIDEIQRQVFHERLNRIVADDYLNEARASDQLGVGTPLERFFNEYNEMARQGIWAEFAQVAAFFEERRHKVMGNLSVLTAGIIGGIIGALIAGAATLYASSTGDDRPARSELVTEATPGRDNPAVRLEQRRQAGSAIKNEAAAK
jgi:hypothetical protein